MWLCWIRVCQGGSTVSVDVTARLGDSSAASDVVVWNPWVRAW